MLSPNSSSSSGLFKFFIGVDFEKASISYSGINGMPVADFVRCRVAESGRFLVGSGILRLGRLEIGDFTLSGIFRAFLSKDSLDAIFLIRLRNWVSCCRSICNLNFSTL